jgi:hypothetical protein
MEEGQQLSATLTFDGGAPQFHLQNVIDASTRKRRRNQSKHKANK